LWRKSRRLIECIVEPSSVTPQIAETRSRTRWGTVRRPCPTPVLYRAYPTQCVFGFMDAQDCKLEEDALVEAMAWRFIAWSMGFFLAALVALLGTAWSGCCFLCKLEGGPSEKLQLKEQPSSRTRLARSSFRCQRPDAVPGNRRLGQQLPAALLVEP